MDDYEIRKKSIISSVQYNLPSIRKGLKLSQTQLAKLLGKSRQGISLIERGELEMSWETCLAIITIVIVREPKYIKNSFGQEFEKDLHSLLKGD